MALAAHALGASVRTLDGSHSQCHDGESERGESHNGARGWCHSAGATGP